MDSACPEKDVTKILRDSDHSTKVAPTTLRRPRRYGGKVGNPTFKFALKWTLLDLPFTGQMTRPRECGARTDFSKSAAEDVGV